MPDSPDILKLRVLLCFLNAPCEECTVTGIARTLKEEKYKISRIIIGLEKEGMIFQKLLLSLGVDKEIAVKDACEMEHSVSSESFEALKILIDRQKSNARGN